VTHLKKNYFAVFAFVLLIFQLVVIRLCLLFFSYLTLAYMRRRQQSISPTGSTSERKYLLCDRSRMLIPLFSPSFDSRNVYLQHDQFRCRSRKHPNIIDVLPINLVARLDSLTAARRSGPRRVGSRCRGASRTPPNAHWQPMTDDRSLGSHAGNATLLPGTRLQRVTR